MELKNALAICLISLFSATLVVMLARWLDVSTASRIEPQLAAIVNELHAIRTQGGFPATTGASPAANAAVENGLVVYYFHSNKRCPTCEAIESQSHAVVQNDFAAALGKNEIVWNVLNYEQPAGRELGQQFDVQMAVVVLAKMKDGKITKWKRLDEVWGLVDDKPAFAAFLKTEIEDMLNRKADGEAPQPPAASPAPIEEPADLPLPAASGS